MLRFLLILIAIFPTLSAVDGYDMQMVQRDPTGSFNFARWMN